jgi:hypothetical protein
LFWVTGTTDRSNATIHYNFQVLNRLTPNDPYMGRTAPLTSKRCILYIYSTNISTEYFKHALYSPFFFSSKCSLFHNANLFGSCIIHILYTECGEIKKNNSGSKGLKWFLCFGFHFVSIAPLCSIFYLIIVSELISRYILFFPSCCWPAKTLICDDPFVGCIFQFRIARSKFLEKNFLDFFLGCLNQMDVYGLDLGLG